MRLTRALSILWKSAKRTPGRLHGGKNQKINPIKVSQKEATVKWMIVEQQNIELLHKPYITQEEEVTYQEDNAELFAVRKKEQEDKEWLDRKAKRPFSRTRPHFTLQDHFEHLNVRKKWE